MPVKDVAFHEVEYVDDPFSDEVSMVLLRFMWIWSYHFFSSISEKGEIEEFRGQITYGTCVMPSVKDMRNPASKIRFAGPKIVFNTAAAAISACPADDSWPLPLESRGVLSSVAMGIQVLRRARVVRRK